MKRQSKYDKAITEPFVYPLRCEVFIPERKKKKRVQLKTTRGKKKICDKVAEMRGTEHRVKGENNASVNLALVITR